LLGRSAKLAKRHVSGVKASEPGAAPLARTPDGVDGEIAVTSYPGGRWAAAVEGPASNQQRRPMRRGEEKGGIHMLTRWNTGWSDFDEMFSAMNQLRSYMDRVLEDGFHGRIADGRVLPFYAGTWPRTNLVDAGANLVLTAEVPGLSENDIKLTLNQEVLTISGERKVQAPEGYSAHRQERATVSFSRSFTLPCRVNAERTTASVKNGILTVTIEKAADAMPRQIVVKAAQ
jgi:HSP20 family protein